MGLQRTERTHPKYFFSLSFSLSLVCFLFCFLFFIYLFIFCFLPAVIFNYKILLQVQKEPKVQFQNSIEKSMGINKTTHFPRYMRQDLVTHSNRANHVRNTTETIVNKSCRSLVTSFLPFCLTFWFILGSGISYYSRLLNKSKLQCEVRS